MEFSEEQVKWLKKATAQDITKVFAKPGLDFKDKMSIQRKWLELHDTQLKQPKLTDNWGKPEDWL